MTNCETGFEWPEGKRCAVSLTFDDGRATQIDVGIPIMNAHGIRGSFYVSFNWELDAQADGWREAIKAGQEVGNHTLTHPCSGNFGFAHHNPLESYDLPRMEKELLDANERLEEMFGIRPTTFAYPCGQTFVGQGETCRSYVPLVAKHFTCGRGYRTEIVNDPPWCDLAQVGAFGGDSQPLEYFRRIIEGAKAQGGWAVFAAHDVHPEGGMDPTVLEDLCKLLADSPDVWTDTVDAIGTYVRDVRAGVES